MERILFGDNQFFAVNHISDEKSRAQSIKFKDDAAIIKTLDYAVEAGINTFMCTTHDRIANICEIIRANPEKYKGVLMGINYGFNKVRFVSPVKVGSRIRARGVTANVELKGNMIEVTRNFTIEIEGEDKPAVAADWITRTVYG